MWREEVGLYHATLGLDFSGEDQCVSGMYVHLPLQCFEMLSMLINDLGMSFLFLLLFLMEFHDAAILAGFF